MWVLTVVGEDSVAVSLPCGRCGFEIEERQFVVEFTVCIGTGSSPTTWLQDKIATLRFVSVVAVFSRTTVHDATAGVNWLQLYSQTSNYSKRINCSNLPVFCGVHFHNRLCVIRKYVSSRIRKKHILDTTYGKANWTFFGLLY